MFRNTHAEVGTTHIRKSIHFWLLPHGKWGSNPLGELAVRQRNLSLPFGEGMLENSTEVAPRYFKLPAYPALTVRLTYSTFFEHFPEQTWEPPATRLQS